MDGFLQLLNQSLVNVSFDFRTTLNDSILIVAFARTLNLAVQISRGRVELVATDPLTTGSKTVAFTRPVTDGKWYSVALGLETGAVTAQLRPIEAAGPAGGISPPEMLSVKLGDFEPGDMLFNEVFIGGVEHRARIAGTALRYKLNPFLLRRVNDQARSS